MVNLGFLNQYSNSSLKEYLNYIFNKAWKRYLFFTVNEYFLAIAKIEKESLISNYLLKLTTGPAT